MYNSWVTNATPQTDITVIPQLTQAQISTLDHALKTVLSLNTHLLIFNSQVSKI